MKAPECLKGQSPQLQSRAQPSAFLARRQERPLPTPLRVPTLGGLSLQEWRRPVATQGSVCPVSAGQLSLCFLFPISLQSQLSWLIPRPLPGAPHFQEPLVPRAKSGLGEMCFSSHTSGLPLELGSVASFLSSDSEALPGAGSSALLLTASLFLRR